MKRDGKILLERLMVFSISTSFILSCLFVFEACVNSGTEKTNLFNWFSYVLVVVSGLVFMFALDFFVSEKTKIGVHIRFVIFYLISMLILLFFFGALDAPYVLIPVTIVQYALQSTVNDLFVFHDWFVQDYEGKSGKELIAFLFHNNFSATEFAEKRNSAQATVFILGFIQFVFLLVPNLIKVHIPILAYVFAFLFYISLFVFFMMIGLFNKESYYAFLGFDKILENQRKLYKTSFIVFAAGFILSFFVASNKALISIPKLNDRFVAVQNNYQPQTYETQEIPHFEDEMFDFSPDPVKKSPFFDAIKVILKILKFTGIVVFIFFGIFLLVRPFFSTGWKSFVKEKRLYHFFKQLFDDIKDFFKTLFFSDKNDNEAYATVEAKTFKNSIQDFLKNSKKSKAKKNEIDRLTKIFTNLINWGSRRDIIYTRNMAPAEYTLLVSDYLKKSDMKNLLDSSETAGRLYEKALYDKELLSPEEENEFSAAVGRLMNLGLGK